ncbi:hypothetical protein BpHYR1_035352 [Brachionus plicatilis]|uniref:Uncharacterized protein n=1 Tax=Brachionus plicatilis TaxID=10195 RepID=A0A3M7R4S4_BRAPC|nr:hypothetical protein BpHYR1_035352 [Brachionus plicatilis]
MCVVATHRNLGSLCKLEHEENADLNFIEKVFFKSNATAVYFLTTTLIIQLRLISIFFLKFWTVLLPIFFDNNTSVVAFSQSLRKRIFFLSLDLQKSNGDLFFKLDSILTYIFIFTKKYLTLGNYHLMSLFDVLERLLMLLLNFILNNVINYNFSRLKKIKRFIKFVNRLESIANTNFQQNSLTWAKVKKKCGFFKLNVGVEQMSVHRCLESDFKNNSSNFIWHIKNCDSDIYEIFVAVFIIELLK